MSDDAQPVVHLEVTVPRIVFSVENSSQQQANTDDVHIDRQEHEQEQVRVLLSEADASHHTIKNGETAQKSGEAAIPASTTGLFRLFQIKDIPHQGQKLLLQVLRRFPGTTESFSLTAEQAFSLEFRHLDSFDQTGEHTPVLPSQLIPGLNQIVIGLDKDGTVAHFSIDGAES